MKLKEKHIHTYERMAGKSPKGLIYWRCIDPLCYHKIEQSMIEGKACRCFKCNGIFELDKQDLRRKNPRCINCSSTKEALEKQRIRGLLEELDMNTFLPDEDRLV